SLPKGGAGQGPRCSAQSCQPKDHVVVGYEAASDLHRLGLNAPDREAQALVEVLGLRSRLADTELQGADAAKSPGMSDGRPHETLAHALPAPLRLNEHSPDHSFVGGFPLRCAVDTHHAHQPWAHSPEYDGLGRALQLRSNGLLPGGHVIRGGGQKGKWGILERLAAQPHQLAGIGAGQWADLGSHAGNYNRRTFIGATRWHARPSSMHAYSMGRAPSIWTSRWSSSKATASWRSLARPRPPMQVRSWMSGVAP